MKKLSPFLYTNSEISERESKKKKKTVKISSKKIKYFEINLPKEVKTSMLSTMKHL